MANPTTFKLDINLQKLAVSAFAIRLWESPDVRKMVKDCFKDNYPFFKYQDFNAVNREILQRLQTFQIPKEILWEIRDSICFIGKNLFKWHYSLKTDFHLGLEYADKICWSCYGTVDEAKTFQLHWQNDSKLLNSHSKRTLYHIACTLAQKEFITDNLSDMRKILESSIKIPANISADSLISNWFYDLKETDKVEKLKLNREAELLLIFVKKGLLNAVKHFTKCLKEKKSSQLFLHKVAKEALTDLNITNPWLNQMQEVRNNYPEIFLFLINEMSLKSQILYIRETIPDLFSLFMITWRYQEIFLQIFNCILPFMTDDDHAKLLTSVKRFLYQDRNDSNLHYKCTFRQILKIILEAMPKKAKKKMMVYESSSLFAHFIRLKDFATMKVILNDPDIITYREKIMKFCFSFIFVRCERDNFNQEIHHNAFKSWIFNGQFDLLNYFSKEFLKDEEELKEFKYRFQSFSEKLLMKGSYELTDEFLGWIADSEKEKAKLKREIDTVKVLHFWNSNKRFSLSVVNELLKWQFDGDEELIKIVKVAMNKEDFILKEFYRTWGANCMFSVESAKAKCSEFATFFLEVKIVKSEKIIVEDFLKLFCEHVQFPQNFESVNEFLKFCSVPQDQVVEMRRKIRDDVERWIVYFGIEKKRFRIADALVNWIVDSESDKKTIIEKFINSPEGAKLYFKVAMGTYRTCLDSALILLNFWIKPYGNISVIRSNFENLYPGNKCVDHCRRLLEKLEKCEYLLIDDLEDEP